ncbi:MAG: hypothetical protein LAO78_04475 [Acidobacteriia bacterium]|nr:hypothetical protein [Terriglobia bacterium]
MKNLLCSLVFVGLLFSATVHALTDPQVKPADPFTGTWKLSVQKSRYPRGLCPKSMVIVMEPAGDGVHYRSETTYANGNTTSADYTADYKGKEAIVMGYTGLLLPVSLKRLDAHTVVANYKRGSAVVARSRRVVSGDGRVMTITTTSPDKSGKEVTSIGVYDKADKTAAVAKP